MWAPRNIRGTRLANQYANLCLRRAKECSGALIPGLNWKPQRERGDGMRDERERLFEGQRGSAACADSLLDKNGARLRR